MERLVPVAAGRIALAGFLDIPQGATGVVLFAHGSGSSRHSRRNQFVAGELRQAGIATLLFDLLTDAESQSRANVFDIPLLAERLQQVTRWVRGERPDLAVGYFGASTGAAAALVAAAGEGEGIFAVVSRGGRPDLAGDALPQVKAPTLLIVGGNDFGVIELNQGAFARLRCEKHLEIVPGASHLFEEGETLRDVAWLARDWFVHHLEKAPCPSP